MTFDKNNVYGSGLELKDWRLLKEALLCASESPSDPSKEYDVLPERLQQHAVGQIIANHLAGKPDCDLDEAGNLMIGGVVGNWWLVLSKS